MKMLIEIMSSTQIIRSKGGLHALLWQFLYILSLIIPIRQFSTIFISCSFQPFSLAVFTLENLEMPLKVSVVLKN